MGKRNSERRKPQPPKPKYQTLVAVNVEQLRVVLKDFPAEAKIYTTDEGEVVVYQGNETLAQIFLTGF